MAITLFVDDSETFVDAVNEIIHDNDIKDVLCVTSLAEAREIVNERRVSRVVADWMFEGELADGISLLEAVQKQHPKAERILLTSYRLDDSQLKRLRKINGRLVDKADMSEELLVRLLNATAPFDDQVGRISPKVDLAELRLRLARTEETLAKSLEGLTKNRSQEQTSSVKDSEKQRIRNTPDDIKRFREAMEVSFEVVNKSLLLDPANLKKMNRLAATAISGGLLFLVLCLVLVLLQITSLAVVSGLLSLVLSVASRLVFRHVYQTRQSAISQVKDLKPMYSMLTLFNLCQGIKDPSERDKAIAKLIADFSRQSK